MPGTSNPFHYHQHRIVNLPCISSSQGTSRCIRWLSCVLFSCSSRTSDLTRSKRTHPRGILCPRHFVYGSRLGRGATPDRRVYPPIDPHDGGSHTTPAQPVL